MAWFDELFLPPGVTVPIPQFRPPGAFKYGLRDPATGGLHQSVFGTPFIPTPFDESPNAFRPGAAPGQPDVAPKPPLPTRAAPMMGRTPSPATMPMPRTLPEGANPPGAMGMGDLSYPGAMDMPKAELKSAESPKSGWWDKYGETLGSILTQAGIGMMQPSYYGLGGQISQGLQQGFETAQKAPMQRLQKRMLEAQVGKVEGEGNARQALRDFAIQQKLPTGVALSLMLNPDKAAEILEKYDPAMKEAFLKFTEEKSGATERGSYPYKVMTSAAQGALKWGVVGKDRYGNDVYGYPPVPGLSLPGVPSASATPPASPRPSQADAPPGTLSPGTTGLSKGQEKQDTAFAEDVVRWKQEGRADTAKAIEQLRGVRDRLASGERLTGPEIGNLPSRVREITNPTAVQAFEQVQEVVQRNLRLVLGGQFAQLEGKQLIERAYNLRLPPEQNAERVSRLMSAIEQAAKAKEEMAAYFDKYGTLVGYTGPTIDDLRKMVRDSVKESAPSKSADSAIPMTGNRIDIGKLRPGQIYTNQNGVRAKWTGSKFEPVQ